MLLRRSELMDLVKLLMVMQERRRGTWALKGGDLYYDVDVERWKGIN